MSPQTLACRVIGAQPIADRVMRLTINTDDVDSHGTRFLPAGAMLERYQQAPIVMWNHAEDDEETQDPDLAIGRALKLTVDARRISAEVEFEKDNPVADKVLRKLRNGTLFGCSIGALIKQSHPEGDVEVVDRWELCEVSLCFVPSNARCLVERALRAARSLPQRTNANRSADRSVVSGPRSARVNPEEVLKALGLEAGASYDQVCQALMANLADSDEKKALVAAVDAMKPSEGSEGGGDPATASRAADPAADPKSEGEVERKAMRAALTAKDRQIAELQKKLGPTAETAPDEWAKAMVKRGLTGISESELAKMAKADPAVAAKTAELLLPAEARKLPLHTRALGPAANAPATPGPKLGQEPGANAAKSFDARRKAAEATHR